MLLFDTMKGTNNKLLLLAAVTFTTFICKAQTQNIVNNNVPDFSISSAKKTKIINANHYRRAQVDIDILKHGGGRGEDKSNAPNDNNDKQAATIGNSNDTVVSGGQGTGGSTGNMVGGSSKSSGSKGGSSVGQSGGTGKTGASIGGGNKSGNQTGGGDKSGASTGNGGGGNNSGNQTGGGDKSGASTGNGGGGNNSGNQTGGGSNGDGNTPSTTTSAPTIASSNSGGNTPPNTSPNTPPILPPSTTSAPTVASSSAGVSPPSIGSNTGSGSGSDPGNTVVGSNGYTQLHGSYDGKMEFGGAMFDMVAYTDLTVVSAGLHTKKSGRVLAYVRDGSYQLGPDSPFDWNEIYSGYVTSQGNGVPSLLSSAFDIPVKIKAGTGRGLYFLQEEKSLLFTNMNSKGLFLINSDIGLLDSASTNWVFDGAIDAMVFNGSLIYKRGVSYDPVPAPAPTLPAPSPVAPSPSNGGGTFHDVSTFIRVGFGSIDGKPPQFNMDSNASGVMFDIKGLKKLHITTIAFHAIINVETQVRVYYKENTYKEGDRDASKWTMVFGATTVGKGKQIVTPTGTFQKPIQVNANTIYGLYIAVDSVGSMYLHSGFGIGNIAFHNSEINVYTGVGKFFLFGRDAMNKNLVGVLYYTHAAETQPPVPAPVAPPPPSPPCSIVGGGYHGTRGNTGTVFDMVTLAAKVYVTGLELHSTEKNKHFEVYTKHGSFEGFSHDYTKWTLLQGVDVAGSGKGYPVTLPDFTNKISVEANSRRAWYVTHKTECLTCEWMPMTVTTANVGTVYRKNNHIQLLVGKGIRYFFGRLSDFNGGWNGTMRYMLEAEGTCANPPATAWPSAKPSHGKPVPAPSKKPSTPPVIACSSIGAATPCPFTDREHCALLDFFKATQGCSWTKRTHWGGPDKCKWYGITCDKDGVVKGISLYKNNLQGTIPTTIGSFVSATSIELGSNALSGTIPDQFKYIYGLNTLLLDNNQLVGSIKSSGLLCKQVYKGVLQHFYTDCTIAKEVKVKCDCCNGCVAPSAAPSKRPA